MALKLTKADAKQLDALADAYRDATQQLLDFLSDRVAEIEEAIGDKSEKWQEGEAGHAAQARVDAMQEWIDSIPRRRRVLHRQPERRVRSKR